MVCRYASAALPRPSRARGQPWTGCLACSACVPGTRCCWRSIRKKKRGAVVRYLETAKRGFAAALIAAAAALLAPAHAQQRVTLNFVNTEIEAVARAMADFTGRMFVVDPRVKGTVTLIVEKPVGPGEAIGALASALRVQNIALVDAGGVIRIVPEADAKLQGGPVRTETTGARGDEMVTQVFRLNYESAVAIAQVLRPLIASNNPINAYAANNTIVVTDYAENVRRIGRIISAIDTPAGSDIDVVPLQHTIATDVATVLGRLLETPGGAPADASQRVSILAEPSSNTLLIRAPTAARANLVRTLAAKLDQPTSTPGNIHVVYLKNANAVTLARTLLGVAQPEAPSGTQPAGAPPTTTPTQQQQRTPGLLAQPQTRAPAAAGAPVTGTVGGAQ